LSNLSGVEVLLATYNGERFLREQIDSILAQDYASLRVLARDDGSSDGTVAILKEYEERFPDRFRVMPAGASTGSAKKNFLLLMEASTAKHVCFSDQDDVWLRDKVSRTKQAMDKLELRFGTELPLLVFTDLRVVDEKLKVLHESYWEHAQLEPDSIGRLPALLGLNVVSGCTTMINRPLLELACRMPEEASMHDRWIALLASAMGQADVVRAQTLLYRQHERNVVGVEERTGSLSELAQRTRRGETRLRQWEISQKQAEALLRVHGEELSARSREVLKAYLRCGTSKSRIVRITTMVRYGFFRTGLLRNLATIVDLWRLKVA
jgi:glycosyltransferase involved in cell wall biosynthesis